jgi:hypothetical protein
VGLSREAGPGLNLFLAGTINNQYTYMRFCLYTVALVSQEQI